MKQEIKSLADKAGKEKESKRTDDRKLGVISKRPLVWLVVASLVICGVSVLKTNSYFYKKHKKNEEEKTKRRIVL